MPKVNTQIIPIPRLIAWEVTRSCNLNCKHCRAAAHLGPYAGEFSTEECFRVLENIASFCKPIIILTGGEPMLRPDIFDIARHGTDLGLSMVMAPCGSLVTETTVKRMIESGIRRISLSIDGANAATHDAFRQVEGAFDNVINAARVARANALDFQINTTITRSNLQELESIFALAIELGAVAYHPFLLVPTGRGKDLAQEELSPQQYEDVLQWIWRKSQDSPILLKPTCAPHYHRIARQNSPKSESSAGVPPATPTQKSKETNSHLAGASAPSLHALSKGCMGGQSFAFISHVGKLQICGFLETECGDLRAQNYDFQKAWETSEVFRAIRDTDNYHGRCGYCEYRRICGGCRARAYAMSGDYLAEEPFCVYEPKRKSAHQDKNREQNG